MWGYPSTGLSYMCDTQSNLVTPNVLKTALACVLWAVFLYLIDGYHAGFASVNYLGSLLPTSMWQIVTYWGDEHLLLSVVLLLMHRHPQGLHVVTLAVLNGLLLSITMKWSFAGSRPPAVLAAGTFQLIGTAHQNSSFPSGHTQLIFAVVTSILPNIKHCWLKITMISIAVLVGMSRVAVGVHWPIDVLIGAATGLVAAWLAINIAKFYSIAHNPEWHYLTVCLLLIFPLRLLLGYDPGLAWPSFLSPLIGMLIISLLAWDYCSAWFAYAINWVAVIKPTVRKCRNS